MKCIIAFSALGIIRDAQSNNISAFNILEEFSSPGFPLFVQKIYFFSLLEKDDSEPEKHDFKLIISNNEQLLLEMPIISNFQKKMRNRQIVEIGGLAIPSPGNLVFKLIHEEQILCSYSMKVNQIGKPKAKKIE